MYNLCLLHKRHDTINVKPKLYPNSMDLYYENLWIYSNNNRFLQWQNTYKPEQRDATSKLTSYHECEHRKVITAM